MKFFDLSLRHRLLLAIIPGFVPVLGLLADVIFDDWGFDESVTISLFVIYGASLGGLVLAPFITTRSLVVLRFSILVIAATLMSFGVPLAAIAIIEMISGPVLEFVTIGATVCIGTLILAATLVIVAPLRVSLKYWIYVVFSGLVYSAALIAYLNWVFCLGIFVTCPWWSDVLVSLPITVFHMSFCAAVYFGRVGSQANIDHPTSITALIRQQRKYIVIGAFVALAIAFIIHDLNARREAAVIAQVENDYLVASDSIRLGTTLWTDATQKNEHLKAARRLLDEAVEFDPDNGKAWAKLVPTYYLLVGNGLADGSGEMLRRSAAEILAGFAARRAMALAPDIPETWVAKGLHGVKTSGSIPERMSAATADFEKALSLDPNNLAALETYAQYRFDWGHYADAVTLYDRAIAIDPIAAVRLRRAQAMYRAGRVDDARREYFEVSRIYPDAPYEGGIAEIEFDRGHLHHGLVWLAEVDGWLQPPYAWLSLDDTRRALEATARYRSVGGNVASFAELASIAMHRNYSGLRQTVENEEGRELSFLLPSLLYLRQWDEVIQMVENWPPDADWTKFRDVITGGGEAPDYQYDPDWLGSVATRAAYYAHALASVGRREDAVPIWAWVLELADRIPKGTPRRIQEWHHVRLLVFASRGETDAALSELESMVNAGWRWLMSPGNFDRYVYSVDLGWFEDSPLLDNIRHERRFIELLYKVKVDNAAMLAELNAGLILSHIIDEEVDQ